MVILSQITNRAINKIVNENVMNNTGGWNFYVGSNYEPKDNGQHQTEIISLVR